METITKKDILYYQKYFDNLKKDNRFSRLGKTFSTTSNRYFYDTGTGKVLQCNENVHQVLRCLEKKDSFESLKCLELTEEELLHSLEDIENSIEKEKILMAPLVTAFDGPNTDNEALERYVKYGLEQIILELTENCNLKCDYCIYNESNDIFRNFGQKNMTFETAKKAIDYAAEHSGKDIAISFYGGEPLLRFDLIKQCVDYSQKVLKGKKIVYAMTTNLVLMTKELAQYFASIDDFVITCSIDGDKDIHDEHRKFPNGEGSFDKAFSGLKNLVEALGDKAISRLTFSMVLNPPYSNEKFDKIQSFFDSIDWLPRRISKNVSYVQYGKQSKDIVSDSERINEKYIDPLSVWTHKKLKKMPSLKNNKLFVYTDFEKKLLRIHNRRLCEKPMDTFVFNACCVPGSRRMYITSEGKFKLCERIGQAPYIGDVDNGIDMESIKKNYVDDYMKESLKYCKQCWAVHLCNVCYTECYDEHGVNLDAKHALCESTRHFQMKALEIYHELLEKDPESLNYLNDISLT